MPSPVPSHIPGRELRERRLACSYGLRQLAEIVGMRPSALASFEAGRSKHLEEAHRAVLCVILDLPTKWGLPRPTRGSGSRS